jgi:hypothetical protein
MKNKIMKSAKFIFCCIFFVASASHSFAQNDPYHTNNNIGLSNIYSDTLTFEQIKDISSITINAPDKVVISSYIFSYYINDNLMLHSIQGFNSAIQKEEIEKLLGIKPKIIYVTEVLGERGNEILILGQRKFYTKN